MAFLINLIVGIILFFYGVKIYTSYNLRPVSNPCGTGENYYLNKHLHFLLFSIATSMVFLGPFSLVKYVFWFAILVILIFFFRLKFDIIVGSYILFLLWALFSMSYTSELYQGTMLLIKYALPMLYLWLGYNAINGKEDFIIFLKKSNIILILYALFIGGFAYKVFPFLYSLLLFKSGGLFIAYASLADFFTALFVIPLTLYVITKRSKYLYAALWLLLSTVLEVVRTGLGGIALSIMFFGFIFYKWRAVPFVVFPVILFVIAILFIPDVREKMFVDDSNTAIAQTSLTFDNIQSNGRELIWEKNIEKFYKPNPLIGAGLGTSVSYTKDNFAVHLIHSDYVQILCEMGSIGLSIFCLFFIVLVCKVVYCCWFGYNKDDFVRLSGAMAVGSCAGVLFSMAFDNVVSYSQQCFVFPFLFIGIFLKAIDLCKDYNNRFV